MDDLQEQQALGLETSMHDAEQEKASLKRQWRDEVCIGIEMLLSYSGHQMYSSP